MARQFNPRDEAQAGTQHYATLLRGDNWGAAGLEDPDGADLFVPTRSQPRRKVALAVAAGLIALLAVVALIAPAEWRGAPAGPSPASSTVAAATGLLEVGVCEEYPALNLTTLVHNNLGGRGPDNGTEGMVYLGEGSGKGIAARPLELHVNLHSGHYWPQEVEENGFSGQFGTINIKPGSWVNLTLTFHDPETKKVVRLPHFHVTFFDLDEAKNHTTIESVSVSQFQFAHVTNSTELLVLNHADGRTTFQATEWGDGADNPTDPGSLTKEQRDRAVTFAFKDQREVNVVLKATHGIKPRYFTFVVQPTLLCAKTRNGDGSESLRSADVVTHTGGHVKKLTANDSDDEENEEEDGCCGWFCINWFC